MILCHDKSMLVVKYNDKAIATVLAIKIFDRVTTNEISIVFFVRIYMILY